MTRSGAEVSLRLPQEHHPLAAGHPAGLQPAAVSGGSGADPLPGAVLLARSSSTPRRRTASAPAGGRSWVWPMRRYPPSPTRRTAPEHPPPASGPSGEPPEGGAGVPPVPLRPPQGRSHRGAERHERQDLRLPGADPHRGAVPQAGLPGDLLSGDPASGRCCCWTMCCLNWTENGNPLY